MTNLTDGLIDIYDISDNISLLETDVTSDFLDWYSLEGSNRIFELSRQLRSFLNYKCEIMRIRFSKSNRSELIDMKNPIKIRERDLALLFSQYSTLLEKIGIVDGKIAEKIIELIEKVKYKSLEIDIKHFKEIKTLSKKIWNVLHILSELELHRHPRLLNVIIQIASLLCGSESVYFSPFSDFYHELKLNYLQLEGEISNLIPIVDEMRKGKKKKLVKITV